MSAKNTILTWGIGALLFAGLAYGYQNKEKFFSHNDIPPASATPSESPKNPPSQIPGKAEPQAQFKENNISSITTKDAGKNVTIKGIVKALTKSKDGTHTFLTVVDEKSASIMVPIFADKHISIDFKTNDEYYFSGLVDVFNNQLEVIPQKPEDISPVQKQLTLSKEMVGQTKDIMATIKTKYEHPDGHIFLNVLLKDTNQEMEVPIFNNLNYDSSQLSINAAVKITGAVTEYNGKLEVVPHKTTDITIITPGDDSKVTLIQINKISNQDRGKMYQIQGYVTDVIEKDGHIFFTFEDKDKKNIKVVLFRADGNEITGRKTKIVNAGKEHFPIRILAMVDVYKDQLELIIDKVYNDYNG